jgi:exocyst complex protein 7
MIHRMLHLQLEFLFCAFCSKPADPGPLMETLPSPEKHVPETATPLNGGGEEVKLLLTNTPHNDKALNPTDLPVLLSPRVVPQLAEMAQRLVGAGLHQECLKIYR